MLKPQRRKHGSRESFIETELRTTWHTNTVQNDLTHLQSG